MEIGTFICAFSNVLNELCLFGDRDFTELTPQSLRVGAGGHLRVAGSRCSERPRAGHCGKQGGALGGGTLDGHCVVAVTVAGEDFGVPTGPRN